MLAHLSVRARNMHVLFATCFDGGQLEAVEKLAGRQVRRAGLGWWQVKGGGGAGGLEQLPELGQGADKQASCQCGFRV